MLKGDLATTPLAPLLISLADEESTGCVHISDAEGDEALIYFKSGLVYAVTVPGRRPQLGAKLISSGALTPEALSEALEAQRTELQGWKLGELLVHLGFVDQPVVEAFVREQVHDAVWDLIRWTDGRWRFRKNEKTREDVAPPMTVQELLESLRERGVEWEAISHVVHGPTAVPVLSTRGGGAAETTLDADAWSMLCKIDGERSLAELARDCGYTLFEAGQVLVMLVTAGLVDIEEDVDVAAPVEEQLEVAAEVDDDLYGVTSALAAALAPQHAVADVPAGHEADDESEPDCAASAEPVDEIDALARLVSEVAGSFHDDAADDEAPYSGDEAPSPVTLHPGHEDSFASSVGRVSAALADALGPAQQIDDPYEVPAELRRRKTVAKKKPTFERTPESDRREALRAAAAAELAAAHALAEALRDEQDSARRAAEEDAARAAEEEARRQAEEAEAARVAAEEAEAARLAAEAEAARVAAEEAEAARLAAEAEAARVAAEEAEAARLAAEAEAARLAAEEEEAARLAAEEEARRQAAEAEAARLAEEAEAARLAEEAEAARLAEEAEAARLAAEAEAARLAEEAEAARLAAEAEAARLAAEEEARRQAEAEAARRLAEEVASAEDEAWAEYWAREAEEIARREAAAEADAARAAAEAAVQFAAAAEAEAVAAAEAARVADEAEGARLAEEAAERERRSAAVAMLAELATDTAVEPAPVPAVEEPMPAPEPVPVPAHLEPVAATMGASHEMADTAALLRELSSLGFDDEPPATPPPAPRTPPRSPSAPTPAKKKKRGLFGL